MEQDRKMKAFVSWSGGKDAALSYYRTWKDYQVTHLVNMVTEDGEVSRSHGVRTNVLRKQAEALGLTIVQPRSSWETYEAEFKKAVEGLKEEGIEAGIFGDIDLEGHRQWVTRVCRELGIAPVLPLWGEKSNRVVDEFMGAGFDAVVVTIRRDLLSAKWLGRNVDRDFIEDIAGLGDIDPAGENGEYHTFVTSGPVFQRALNITASRIVTIDQHTFFDILDCELVPGGGKKRNG